MTATLGTLGSYRLLEQVGQGGMATVYRAIQPGLDREVAVKVLPAILASQESRERFRREARTVAHLRHPNVVTVFDYGEDESVPYLVCEFVDGGTLASRLAAPLPLHEVVSLLRPVADALDYAHHHSVLHRDVKPSNILLTAEGVPVLADFGVAKMLGRVATPAEGGTSTFLNTLTEPGTLQGTPAYMAPEHATGQPVGEAADLYSLAVVAYEMLTGRVPFDGETPLTVLLAHANAALPSPQSLNPELPDAAEAALLRGLAKQPEQRFPTATAFIDALDAALATTALPAAGSSNESIVSSKVPTSVVPALQARTMRRHWRLGFVVLTAALGVAALSLTAYVYVRGQAVRTAASRQTARPPRAAQTATAAVPAALAVIATGVPQSTALPTGEPATPAPPAPTAVPPSATPTADQLWRDLQDDLDATWGADWPKTLALIDAFRTQFPTYAPATTKLYAALVSYGEQRLAAGDRAGGIAQFERARSLAPSRPEAVDALRALTPTPRPPTATVPRPTQTTAPSATRPPQPSATNAPPAVAATTAPSVTATRAPTATPAPPTATAPPTGTPGPGAVLLSDTFDDPASTVLPAATNAAGILIRGYESSAFVIRRPDPLIGQTIQPIPGIFRNTTLAFDVRVVGDVANRQISASCRNVRVGTGYVEYEFRMYPSPGTADLRRRDAGEAGANRTTFVTLAALKTYPSIKRGNETNHVEMTCAGDQITVWLNGQSLIAVKDGTYAEGGLSFALGAESLVKAEAQFENLVVTQR